MKNKREVLQEVRKMLEQLGCDFIVVVEGASITHVHKAGIIRDLRTHLSEYERSIGEDPDHDWLKE